MNIKKIFRETGLFSNIELDVILFESKYPVLFTCKDEDMVYLFICCLANSRVVKWIGTQISYERLIALLENRTSIRNALLDGCEEKIEIEYRGSEQDVTGKRIKPEDIAEQFLPDDDEYMEAEEGEFEEEIQLFKMRIRNREVSIKLRDKRIIFFKLKERCINMPDYNIMTGLLQEGVYRKISGYRKWIVYTG